MLNDIGASLRMLRGAVHEGRQRAKPSKPGRVVRALSSSAASASRHLPLIYALCVVPAVASAVLSFAMDMVQALHVGQPTTTMAVVATVLTLVAIPLTHGLTGKQLYPSHWHFFQPLRGGITFIALQFFSWLFFAGAIIATATWFALMGLGVEHSVLGLWTMAGVACIASEVLMIASLQVYDGKASLREAFVLETSRLREAAIEGLVAVRQTVVIAVFCNMQFALAATIVLPFVALPLRVALPVATIFWSLYATTYEGHPEDTGKRRWEGFRSSFFLHDIRRYFNGQVIVDTDLAKLDRAENYIFALAPHGIMPLTGAWLPMHPDFVKAFGSFDVFMLGASILNMTPLLRDPAQWAGTRQVTKPTFLATLRDGKSVLMIPGGVSELCVSSSREKKIRLITGHKGFVRVAIEAGKPLVPMFSFGETLYFDYINIPILSELLLKFVGTPFPYFVGVGNFLQFPRKVPVTVVVGDPIPVPKEANPTPEQVDAVHRKFYEAIALMFERHKTACGHEEYSLEFVKSRHHGHGRHQRTLSRGAAGAASSSASSTVSAAGAL